MSAKNIKAEVRITPRHPTAVEYTCRKTKFLYPARHSKNDPFAIKNAAQKNE